MSAANALFRQRPRSGMIVRSEIELAPKTRLFKLGHRFVRGIRRNDLEVLATPWWLGEALGDVRMQKLRV